MDWQGSTSRKRSSASCVKRRSYWHRAGRWRMRVGGSVDRCHRAELLPLAQRVWRPDDGSGSADERAGEGERPVAPGGIGPDTRQADPAGSIQGTRRASAAKLLSPARRRRCINHIRTMMPVSERRVCRVLGQHRSTQRKTPRGLFGSRGSMTDHSPSISSHRRRAIALTDPGENMR